MATIKWNVAFGILLALCTDGILYVWRLDTGHLERRVTGNALLLQGGAGGTVELVSLPGEVLEGNSVREYKMTPPPSVPVSADISPASRSPAEGHKKAASVNYLIHIYIYIYIYIYIRVL